jgi:class 3 adenylate cyclase
MPHAQRKNLKKSEDVRRFPNGTMHVVSIEEYVIGYARFEPGWRWSVDVAPVVGTSTCTNRHVGVTLGGVMHVETDDGATMEIGPMEAFEIPPGHDAWVVGAEPWVAVEFTSSHVYGKPPGLTGDRVLTTILFTDIVGSTATIERIGDPAWADMLVDHNHRMRAEIERFGGHELDTTGDGFLAMFDGAGRAVHCGARMARAAAELGIDIRVGAHSGEVEIVAGNAQGLVVHEAARVMALAGPGEVLVSSTTRDLLAGSGLEFESRGAHELKGLSGPREVFRLQQESVPASPI